MCHSLLRSSLHWQLRGLLCRACWRHRLDLKLLANVVVAKVLALKTQFVFSARARGKIKAENLNAIIAKEKGSHPAALAKAPGKKSESIHSGHSV